MDPTVTLRELREAIIQLGSVEFPDVLDDVHAARHAVIERWSALDTWLSNGGFPPAQWGNLTTKPEPIRVKDVDEMLDLLAPDPWRTAANVLGVNVPPTMEDEARAELERRGDA